MPRTETIEVYSFSELPKTLQKKAIDNLRDVNVDIEWWEDIYYQVENQGYKGFYGKISSFDSRVLEFEISSFDARVLEFEWLEYDSDKLASEFREYFQPVIKTREDWYNAHRTERMIRNKFVTCNIKYRTLHGAILEPDVDDSDSRNDYCFKLATTFMYPRLQAFIKTVLQELETEYYYRVSDEAIIDNIEANEYEFIIVNNNVKIFI